MISEDVNHLVCALERIAKALEAKQAQRIAPDSDVIYVRLEAAERLDGKEVQRVFFLGGRRRAPVR